MKTLEGKIAVVTGGNSGIGLATANLLRQEGAKVVISGRDESSLAAAAKEIGGDTLAIRADISKPEDLDALFAKVVKAFGKIEMPESGYYHVKTTNGEEVFRRADKPAIGIRRTRTGGNR